MGPDSRESGRTCRHSWRSDGENWVCFAEKGFAALMSSQEGECTRNAGGWLLVALAAVTWGTTGTTSKFLAASAHAGPLLVGFVRMAVAAPLLLAAATSVEGRPRLTGLQPLAAGVCMACYQLCFFGAVPLAGVATTALLAICTAPIMIAALAAIFLHERLTRRILLALAAGVAGAVLLAVGSGGQGGRFVIVGGLLALGAGLSYATYAVLTKAGLGVSRPLSLAAITFSMAAVLLLPVLVHEHPTASTFAAGWPLFFYLGAVPTALAYVLYTYGLRSTAATSAGIAGL